MHVWDSNILDLLSKTGKNKLINLDLFYSYLSYKTNNHIKRNILKSIVFNLRLKFLIGRIPHLCQSWIIYGSTEEDHLKKKFFGQSVLMGFFNFYLAMKCFLNMIHG